MLSAFLFLLYCWISNSVQIYINRWRKAKQSQAKVKQGLESIKGGEEATTNDEFVLFHLLYDSYRGAKKTRARTSRTTSVPFEIREVDDFIRRRHLSNATTQVQVINLFPPVRQEVCVCFVRLWIYVVVSWSRIFFFRKRIFKIVGKHMEINDRKSGKTSKSKYETFIN